jgi:hypothetical protein
LAGNFCAREPSGRGFRGDAAYGGKPAGRDERDDVQAEAAAAAVDVLELDMPSGAVEALCRRRRSCSCRRQARS